MQPLSFILAFAFMLICPALAGHSEASGTGIGTFAYNGSPVAVSAPHAIVVAIR